MQKIQNFGHDYNKLVYFHLVEESDIGSVYARYASFVGFMSYYTNLPTG